MTELPRFRDPPVMEAVLAVQFSTIPLTNALAGLFWGELRERYKAVIEQPPLAPVFETFGGEAPPMQHLPLAFWGPSSSRFWYVSNDDIDVLQLQSDRAVRNWRKRSHEQRYPGYLVIKKSFERDLSQLVAFAEKEQLGLVVPNQCEISYTSIITPPDEADAGKEMSRITPICPPNPTAPEGAIFEGTNTQARFQLNDCAGSPIGRLYASFAPQLALDGKTVIRVDILARGRPPETVSGALEFMDTLHRAAVTSFEALTTPEMHKIWGAEHGV